MKEKAMRKWGAWMASAVLVAVTTILTVAPGGRAEAKNNSSVQPAAAASGADSGTIQANADTDTLDLQLD